MKVLHLKSVREGFTLRGLSFDKETGTYESCCWKFRIEEARTLIDGKIFLHETKSQPSTVGGTVVAVRQSHMPGRVIFVFKSEPAGKGRNWQGQDHVMAWMSGIIDVELSKS